MPARFLIVQPWTQHLARRFIDATVVSEHHTVEDSYAALDAMAERMAAHGGIALRGAFYVAYTPTPEVTDV